jgi:hypothetical protein
MHDYVHCMTKMHSSAVRCSSVSMSVFPAFMDRDFMFPLLLIKFYTALHAGLCWNKYAMEDMLGEFPRFHEYIQLTKRLV